MALVVAVGYFSLIAMHMVVQGTSMDEAMARAGFEVIGCFVAGSALAR